RQAAHHEQQGIERMDSVAAEPSLRSERRWRTELGLMKYSFRERPAGAPCLSMDPIERRQEPPVVTADCNQSPRLCGIGELHGVGKARRDRLFDEQMLAGFNRGEAERVMHSRTAEQIHHVNIVTGDRR